MGLIEFCSIGMAARPVLTIDLLDPAPGLFAIRAIALRGCAINVRDVLAL